MKAQLKARDAGGWKKVEWSLARRPHLHELEVVHGRLIAQNPKVKNHPDPLYPSWSWVHGCCSCSRRHAEAGSRVCVAKTLPQLLTISLVPNVTARQRVQILLGLYCFTAVEANGRCS